MDDDNGDKSRQMQDSKQARVMKYMDYSRELGRLKD
jgi:hypothetical protein